MVEPTSRGDQRGLVSDGLPTLETGEPVLHRWFVLAMLVLVPVALAVSVWALLSIPRGEIPPELRRPVGDEAVTIARGDAEHPQSDGAEAGPGCAEEIRITGDAGARAAAWRALGATCQLLDSSEFALAEQGLDEWIAMDGELRMATFELSGVESSARVEEGRIVVESNAKFIYEDATRAAPSLVHQLVLIADDHWPGAPVGAESELAATIAQHDACRRLSFGGALPRGCDDVAQLLALDDPLGALVDAGFPAAAGR
ncbi:MAG: hypothetical protein WD011_07880 [Nitriliruptoraceae bacterium]